MNIGSVDPNFTGVELWSWKCTANDGIWKYLVHKRVFITIEAKPKIRIQPLVLLPKKL
jgi:hypothetical protein